MNTMNTSSLTKEVVSRLAEQLRAKKEQLEKELSSFATKDPNLKGDWDSQYPRTPQGNLEEAADEVEEYSTRLNLEFNLETQLKNVTSALEKVARGAYGVCEKCAGQISEERLKASPEARLCEKCLPSGGLP